MERNFYSVLGLERSASEADIKRAYRKLAQKHHPDVNKGDAEAEKKFKEVNLAYEVLSDRKKRAQYDQFGFTGNGPAGGAGFGGFSGFDPSQFGGFSDIFETFFGGTTPQGSRSKRRGPQPGNDIESVLRLSLEESVFGIEKTLEVTKAETCTRCQGQGAEPGSLVVSCPECKGAGQIRSIRQTLLGAIQTVRPCPQCHGEGRIPEKKCQDCHGQTRTRQKTALTVKIPAGIENGSTIRLKGKGEAGHQGGEHGDLYLHLQVSPHPRFKRQGYDIHSMHSIHVLQGILGDTISVDTLYGPVKLKIPTGTQPEQTFKIKDHGVPHMRGPDKKGDHYVKVQVDLPKKPTRREKELYTELAKEAGLSMEDDGGLFSRFK